MSSFSSPPIPFYSPSYVSRDVTRRNYHHHNYHTPSEIPKQIKDSNPVLVFTTSEILSKITAAAKLPIVLMNEERVDSMGVVGRLVEMMKEPSGNRVKERVDQDDTATLLYSSGTTRMSKGLISSHRNLFAMVQTIVQRFGYDDGSQGEQRFICTVPMFHIYGFTAFASGILAYGSRIIVLSKFEMHEMMSTIGKYHATFLWYKDSDKRRSRLLRHLFSSNENNLYQNVDRNRNIKRVGNPSNGCKSDFSKWRIRR